MGFLKSIQQKNNVLKKCCATCVIIWMVLQSFKLLHIFLKKFSVRLRELKPTLSAPFRQKTLFESSSSTAPLWERWVKPYRKAPESSPPR